MGSLLAFMLAATAAGGSTALPAHAPVKAVAPAQAFVRILPGAKVSLSEGAKDQGYRLTDAKITSENGTRRSAKLVEFQ